MTRLQRFRQYMACMNPVADPMQAFQDGLHVARLGSSVSDQLAARLELEPTSTHLVLGGVGSGKTSELLRVEKLLRERLSDEGDHIEYIDVSKRHDLTASRLSGVLTALAALALATAAERRSTSDGTHLPAAAIRALRAYALGHHQWLPPDVAFQEAEREEWASYENASMVLHHFKGALLPPDGPIPEDLESLIPHFRALCSAYPGENAHVVLLFDSLDRLPDSERFREAVEHDLRILKAAGIGVGVVGPVRLVTANDRRLTDLFDQSYFQLPTDTEDPAGLEFLKSVLRRRADPELLPDECLEPLSRASGGVLRDLIALAKSAGQEAYAAGHDPISRADVHSAVDAFGRNLAVGLDDFHVEQLKHLRRGGGFVIRGERELSLLETRRVLLYGGSHWAVHPALAPLLDAVPEAA